MSVTFRSGLGALGLLLVLASAAPAQTDHMHFGPRAHYDVTNSDLGLGVQFSGPISRRFEFYPSGDIFFVDVGSRWQANFDFKYRFPAEAPLWFYLGAGLGVDSRSIAGNNEMNAGLNLLAGIEPMKGQLHPFLEVRMTTAEETRAGVAVGLNFTLGKAKP